MKSFAVTGPLLSKTLMSLGYKLSLYPHHPFFCYIRVTFFLPLLCLEPSDGFSSHPEFIPGLPLPRRKLPAGHLTRGSIQPATLTCAIYLAHQPYFTILLCASIGLELCATTCFPGLFRCSLPEMPFLPKLPTDNSPAIL